MTVTVLTRTITRDQDRRQDIVTERAHDSPRNVFRSQRHGRDKLYPRGKVAEGPDSAAHPLYCYQRPGAILALSHLGPCSRSCSNSRSRGHRCVKLSSSIAGRGGPRATHLADAGARAASCPGPEDPQWRDHGRAEVVERVGRFLGVGLMAVSAAGILAGVRRFLFLYHNLVQGPVF
ncbi:hypothetical protein BJV78DRAFT_927853 [Lactifluus subvellereus]|nr:hypothetical protein BJV78DRAFT_927853 [Lactifluus subvellereus]